jgi:hypothetical protein
MPGWVKVSGIIVAVLVLLLVVVLLVAGGHGPRRHASGDAADHGPRSSVTASPHTVRRWPWRTPGGLGRAPMTMPPGLRKLMLAAHLSCSLGWIGAVVAYLALGVAAATSQDAQTVRAAWIAMELTGWYVIVPLALAALVTGLVMALGTPWACSGTTGS